MAYFNQKANKQVTSKTNSGVKVRSLVAYFNQKTHEQVTPKTSAPRHHDWKAILGEKVWSLVLNFSRVGISPPESNSRISIASPVTGDGVYFRVGRMVGNDCALSGSKGVGKGGAPMESTLLRVSDALLYVVSSSEPISGVDRSFLGGGSRSSFAVRK